MALPILFQSTPLREGRPRKSGPTVRSGQAIQDLLPKASLSTACDDPFTPFFAALHFCLLPFQRKSSTSEVLHC
jgi:hypothetical protein